MPLHHYGALVGHVVDRRTEGGDDSPHYQIHVTAGGVDYRLAVNVQSTGAPPDLLYAADEHVEHPIVARIAALPEGFTAVRSAPDGVAVDLVRGGLVTRSDMHVLPATAPGPDNDLSEKIEHFAARAQTEPGALVYAFGDRWGPEDDTPDKIFGFSPGNGVHDIHMNQGNDQGHRRDDGVWQDGALLFRFADPEQWVAIFLAFPSQSWHTDDRTGHTVHSSVNA